MSDVVLEDVSSSRTGLGTSETTEDGENLSPNLTPHTLDRKDD